MSEQSNNLGKPIWIAANQIGAVANALKAGNIAAVQKQLAGQTLTELTDLFQSHAGKSVSLWGPESGEPIVAIAEFPNGQLSIATKGAILLPFKDCCGSCESEMNAALMTTEQQQYQFFGRNPKNKIPQAPAFRAPESDLGHYATHMIGKPHNCSGLEGGPGGMG